MKISGAFPSKYLKASDLPDDQDVPVVIDDVQMERMEQTRDEKPVCYFRGKERGLVLNQTNANTISDAYGDDTEYWRGQPITLFATTTEFGGKVVPCIRLKVSRPTPPPPPPPPAQPNATPDSNSTDAGEIPF